MISARYDGDFVILGQSETLSLTRKVKVGRLQGVTFSQDKIFRHLWQQDTPHLHSPSRAALGIDSGGMAYVRPRDKCETALHRLRHLVHERKGQAAHSDPSED